MTTLTSLTSILWLKAISPSPLNVPQELGHFSCRGSTQEAIAWILEHFTIRILPRYLLCFILLFPSAPFLHLVPTFLLSPFPESTTTHSQPVPSDYNAKPCLFTKTFLCHHSSFTFPPLGSVSNSAWWSTQLVQLGQALLQMNTKP